MKLRLLLVLLSGGPILVQATDTAFTYQGRLHDNGGPATGVYDLRLAIRDAATGGSQIGPVLTHTATLVSGGLFAVALDFGPNVFTGPARWLEIGVRSNGVGGFVTLAPRQPVSPAPYAIFAANAANAASASNVVNGAVVKSLNNLRDNVTLAAGANVTITPSGNTLTIGASGINPWQTSGSNISYLAGNVGIGIAAPNAPLHIAKRVPVLALQDEGVVASQVGLVSFRNSAGTETGWLGFGSSGNADATFMNNRDGGRTSLGAGGLERLTVTSGGDAGIGTTAPQARLDVRGDIRLGASGQFRATSGEENLRIVRGVVAANGSILAGSGFTVTHNSVGNYVITFNTPFAGPPSVTATAERRDEVDSLRSVMTDGVTSANATLVTRDSVWGGWMDMPFHFIAVGRR